MGVLFPFSGLLLSLLFILSFCNGKNMTVKIVGFIDCNDCIIQEFDSNQASLGLKVAISCKPANGEMQTIGNSGVDREGKFNMTLSNQITDGETTVQGCLAKLHDASGAPCPIQTAQTASMKIIRSEDNGTQRVDVTQKLKFSPGTCQSAFFWPFIRRKFFGRPNITYVPKSSPPPGTPVEYTPPPLQALPPPAPAPVSIDPSLPPTQSLAPSFPPAQAPIQYSTPAPAPRPIYPSLPPTQLAPSPMHQNSVPPPTPACKYPSSPPVQSLPPTIPPAPVKGPYPTLAPSPTLTFESPISSPVPAPTLSPPPSMAPVSPKPDPPTSPIEKALPPSKTSLPSVPNSPPSNGNSIIIPRAPPVPKLPPTPTVPRRFFNPPKSKYLPPHPSHHFH